MEAESYNLLYFFNELIKIGLRYPGRPGWGNPCSHLIESLVLTRDKFVDRICNDYTRSSHEFRLNGAGLKMYWEVRREKDKQSKFVCSIAGDQAKEYPEFVEHARKFVKERGCAKWMD